MTKPIISKLALALIFSLCFSIQANALSTDNSQPANIEADDIEFDFKNGSRTYIGNVLAVQGSLKIKADKLIATYKGSDLQTATAWGSLARFKQRPDGKEYYVEGSAKKILVNQVANTLTLIGNASLKQGPDTARGEKIVYNMATDTMSITGGGSKGGAQVAANQPATAKPKRKLKDPFAEKPVGNTVSTSSKNSSSDNNASDGDNDSRPAPIIYRPSGRSRLIIQPK